MSTAQKEIVRVELGEVHALLEAALALVENIDGTEVVPDVEIGPRRKSQPHMAALSRDLLWLQTMLTSAAAESGMQYHLLKGRIDPREEI